MQQNSLFYFFRTGDWSQVIRMPKLRLKEMTKTKSTSALLVPLFCIFLLLGLCSSAVAQIRDTTLRPERVDTVPKLDTNTSPAVAAPATDTARTDSVGVQPDSTLKEALRPFSLKLPGSKEHTPKGATIRSLILPGWGQAYNHEYWKVPLAVAAVGIPVYLFIDNGKEYNAARRAYSVVFEEMPVVSGGKGKLDPAKFAQIDQKFQDAYNRYKQVGGNYVTNFLSTVQSYRNTFRQYRDYSVVAALLGWGLQIADATVFGHLHGFDVGDDLSLKVRPVYFQYARIPGIGLSLNF